MKINQVYQKQIEQIKVDGEQIALDKLKELYKKQKVTREDYIKEVAYFYAKNSKDNKISLDTYSQMSILNKMKDNFKDYRQTLNDAEIGILTETLFTVYKDTYYKNAFILDSGLKVDLQFPILKKEFIDAAINQKYKSEIWSDRIWKNKTDLVNQLQLNLQDAMQGNKTLNETIKDIKDRFNVSAYQSKRLVITENSRIQSQASLDIAEGAGVKQVIYSATLDGLVSPECAALDGQVWDLGSSEIVTPPENHPNCRCILVNVPFEGWQPSVRKDNISKDIIDYKTYDKWKADKGID